MLKLKFLRKRQSADYFLQSLRRINGYRIIRTFLYSESMCKNELEQCQIHDKNDNNFFN